MFVKKGAPWQHQRLLLYNNNTTAAAGRLTSPGMRKFGPLLLLLSLKARGSKRDYASLAFHRGNDDGRIIVRMRGRRNHIFPLIFYGVGQVENLQ